MGMFRWAFEIFYPEARPCGWSSLVYKVFVLFHGGTAQDLHTVTLRSDGRFLF